MTEMNRALVFGANLGSWGLITHLKNEGYHCTALGHDLNQIGASISDSFHLIDYHDLNSIPESVRLTSFDIVLPGSHDMFYKSYCAYRD